MSWIFKHSIEELFFGGLAALMMGSWAFAGIVVCWLLLSEKWKEIGRGRRG